MSIESLVTTTVQPDEEQIRAKNELMEVHSIGDFLRSERKPRLNSQTESPRKMEFGEASSYSESETENF